MRNKLIHYIPLCCILFTACSEETLPKDTSVSPNGEEVEVILNLAPQPLQTPAPTTKSSAGNSNPNVLAFSYGEAMDIELLAEQPDANTREGSTSTTEGSSTATDQEKYIDNVWIFLFDGPSKGTDGTDNDPKLIKKLYKSDFNNEKGIALIKKSGKQLFVVLANSFDPTLAKDLTVDNTAGTIANASKYSDLKKLYSTINISSTNPLIPMSGTLDFEIPETTDKPIEVKVPVKRIAAKVTINVKLGEDFSNTKKWTAQLCDIAPIYWFPTVDGITAPFPADTQTFSAQNEEAITLSTTNETLTYYVPMNLRGTITSGNMTGPSRFTNAPKLATYIRLTHNSEKDNVWTQKHYYIHLGANFTDDYNVLRNTHYTYNITLYPNSESDSRIAVKTLSYTGMFGGKLVNNGGVWQFSEKLWIEDEETIVSSNNWKDTNVTDFIDGKANSLAMAKSGKKVICLERNKGFIVNKNTTVDDGAYQWYMPAQGQLVAVWVVCNSFQKKLTNGKYYWSSTTGNKESFFMYCQNGYISATGLKGNSSDVIRCVNEFSNDIYK